MPSWRFNRHVLTALGLGALVALADQLSKAAVVGYFEGIRYSSVDLVGEWLRFSYTTNSGAAFGILPDQKALFFLVAALVVPDLLYLAGTEVADSWPVRLSLGLMLGGTVGNLMDRLRLGYVVDFVDAGLGALRWPAFNVADAAFVVGAIVVAVLALLWPQPHGQGQVGDGTPPA
ncbi:MAG: signal peptidase II [Chloroflexota bacterium]